PAARATPAKKPPRHAPKPETKPEAAPPAKIEQPREADDPGARTAGGEPDIAYGAYQRGFYLAAFHEATKRVNAKGDPRSMTLIAELYANGYGIVQDDTKAV